MTYAIIEASGKQFRVEAGRFYDFDRMHVEEDASVTIDNVLFISHDGESMVGQPLVEGATVSGTVMRHLRGRKVIVYKMKPKKKTRKKRGHRQELTRLMIDAISLNGELLVGNDTPTSEPAPDPESVPVSNEAPAEAVEDATEAVEETEATAETVVASASGAIEDAVEGTVETIEATVEAAAEATEELVETAVEGVTEAVEETADAISEAIEGSDEPASSDGEEAVSSEEE